MQVEEYSYYYSEGEEEFTPQAGRATWLTPCLKDTQTNTVFPHPHAEVGHSVDFNQSVRGLDQVTGVERNIKGHVITEEVVRKKCNFVFLPGTLFGRKIVSK